jgi:8-oxo-dGTP pyrophosphatase MutT (NUDIX family)
VLPRVAKAFIFYRNHLTNEDQVLLLVRSATDPHRPGSLDIPGGAIEDSETLEQAIAREISEETGIEVDPSSLQEITDSGAVSNESNVEKHVFIARIENPEFTVSVEHESGAWYPLMEAARLFPHPFYGKVLGYIIDHQLHQNV